MRYLVILYLYLVSKKKKYWSNLILIVCLIRPIPPADAAANASGDQISVRDRLRRGRSIYKINNKLGVALDLRHTQNIITNKKEVKMKLYIEETCLTILEDLWFEAR